MMKIQRVISKKKRKQIANLIKERDEIRKSQDDTKLEKHVKLHGSLIYLYKKFREVKFIKHSY